MFKTKAFDATIQGAGDGALRDGQFNAIVSTYSKDSYGDVVVPGAFTDTLAEWAAKGQQIPVIWAHDWNDPFSHIGVVESARETDRGLEVTGYISPEERADNSKAAQIWRLMKARRVTQFSFAFDVIDGGFAERDGQQVYELRKLKVHEVGPCLLGVNQETELIAAKSHALEKKNLGATARKALSEAYEAIGHILDVTPADDDGEDAANHQDQPAANGRGDTESNPAANPAEGSASDPEQIPPSALLQRLELDIAIAEAETD